MKRFKGEDEGYLGWVHSNPGGFVVNVDVANSEPKYPMVHSASCGYIKTPARENYTTNEYFKFCSNDLAELEQMSLVDYKRPLNWCKVCAKKRRALSI